MIRLLPLLLLAGCATHQSSPGSDADPAVVEQPSAEIKEAPSCKRLERKLLQLETKAEGPIALAASVATKRGEQVDLLNSRLTAIARALDAGCIK